MRGILLVEKAYIVVNLELNLADTVLAGQWIQVADNSNIGSDTPLYDTRIQGNLANRACKFQSRSILIAIYIQVFEKKNCCD